MDENATPQAVAPARTYAGHQGLYQTHFDWLLNFRPGPRIEATRYEYFVALRALYFDVWEWGGRGMGAEQYMRDYIERLECVFGPLPFLRQYATADKQERAAIVPDMFALEDLANRVVRWCYPALRRRADSREMALLAEARKAQAEAEKGDITGREFFEEVRASAIDVMARMASVSQRDALHAMFLHHAEKRGYFEPESLAL
jgi:hypothetical protein